jgi:hypothetical protein
MPRALPTLDEHLERVTDETTKAACYLAAALAPRLVPRLQERWHESPTQLAFQFMRQGTHMAFLVTLAALLEETRKERVNLPKLLRRLDDQAVCRAIATRRGLEPSAVYDRKQVLQQRFGDDIAPLIPRVKDVRDNVVAHFGRVTDWPESTVGVLTLVMIRAVVLVDAVNGLVTGDATNIRETMSTVRYQAASLWSKGIDGDLEVGPSAPDDDDRPGIPSEPD